MALEAGRKRGSIKKSRHAAVVEAIELAVREVGKNVLSPTQQIEKTKSKTTIVKTDYEQLKENIIKFDLNPEDFDFYLETFKYGMPPHGGFAIGLERLTMKILKLSNIREASLVPRDMKRLTP